MSASWHFTYRQKAFARYVEQRDQDILPRLVAPPVFIFFWTLIGLLIIIIGIALSIQVPVYTHGQALIIAPSEIDGNQQAAAMALVVFTPDQLSRLQVGQAVRVYVDAAESPVDTTIATIVPEILSPDEVRSNYQLEDQLAATVRQPSVLAQTDVMPPLTLSLYAGSVLPVEVETGSQRLITLFTQSST